MKEKTQLEVTELAGGEATLRVQRLDFVVTRHAMSSLAALGESFICSQPPFPHLCNGIYETPRTLGRYQA